MVDCDNSPARRRRDEHPAWCVQQTWDIGHRSEEYEITPDERAGIGITLALHGRVGSELIEIMIRPYDGKPPYPVLVPDTSGACCDEEPTRALLGEWNGEPVRQHPGDPIYVTDAHGHDMTLAQAGEVYRALGELLALAHCELRPSVSRASLTSASGVAAMASTR